MRLAQRQPDGSSLREHLLAAQAASGRADEQLAETVPPECAALWGAFVDLSSARPQGLGGAGAMPPSELLAWQHLHGVALTSWEIDTLAAMDRAALAVAAEHNTPKGKA